MHLICIEHTLAVFALGLSVVFLLPQRTANSHLIAQENDTDTNSRASYLPFD